jgi:hypothetical protein
MVSLVMEVMDVWVFSDRHPLAELIAAQLPPASSFCAIAFSVTPSLLPRTTIADALFRRRMTGRINSTVGACRVPIVQVYGVLQRIVDEIGQRNGGRPVEIAASELRAEVYVLTKDVKKLGGRRQLAGDEAVSGHTAGTLGTISQPLACAPRFRGSPLSRPGLRNLRLCAAATPLRQVAWPHRLTAVPAPGVFGIRQPASLGMILVRGRPGARPPPFGVTRTGPRRPSEAQPGKGTAPNQRDLRGAGSCAKPDGAAQRRLYAS